MMQSNITPENYIDLRPNTALLDPKFDSYKLSLESFPSYHHPVKKHVLELQTSNSQYGLEHIKLFSDINHLNFDHFSSDIEHKYFYIILDNFQLCAISFDVQRNAFTINEMVLSLTVPSDYKERQDRYPPTISFTNTDYAVISNGYGQITLYETGNRVSGNSWKECLSLKPLSANDTTIAFVVVESRIIDNEIKILLRTIIPKEKMFKKGNFLNKVVLVSLIKEGGKWLKYDVRHTVCDGHLEMVAIDGNAADSLIMVSCGNLEFCQNSIQMEDQEMADASKSTGDTEANESRKRYVWTQTQTDVTAVFNVATTISKSDVNLSLSTQAVHLALGGCVLIGGVLGGTIEPASSTYTIGDGKLELFLSKAGNSMLHWTELVVGDQYGTYEIDPNLMETATELLERFTSETQAIGESGCANNFNIEQLEECDVNMDELCKIRWLNLKTAKVTHECDITGHTPLFSVSLGSDTRHLCLRMDVDGILFAFTGDSDKIMHKATFNAFGYVQASKSQRRFSICPPNCSYAAIIEAKRHAFVYWQPMAINSDLRNRRTGNHIADVAVQHLISLTKLSEFDAPVTVPENIIGTYADNNILFILTTADIFAIILERS